jgi:hypothetical protein
MFKVVFAPTLMELGTLRMKFKAMVSTILELLRSFTIPPSVER